MSNWVGYAVSVNCGEPLGCYQGTILETDGSTITLTKAFRNGFPYPKSQVTLNAADIKDLKIIEESRPEPVKQTHSTVAVTKSNKKGQRATVCENLQANPSNVTSAVNNQQIISNVNQTHASKPVTSTRSTGQGPTRSKPIDIQSLKINKNNNHAGCQTGSWGAGGVGGVGGSTPGGRGRGTAQEKARRRNEACFGDAAEPALLDDFDFEGNLALFDKQALWEQMRNETRPDVVRGAEEAGGGGGGGGGGAQLRHDESVLGAAPAAPRALWLPDELRGPLDYRTDDGVLLPSATSALRRRLWTALRESSPAAALCAHVLLARACADVALRLVGGGRRLDARNAHQAPVCVALAGAHRIGAAAVLCARLLHAHAARAHVLPAGTCTVQCSTVRVRGAGGRAPHRRRGSALCAPAARTRGARARAARRYVHRAVQYSTCAWRWRARTAPAPRQCSVRACCTHTRRARTCCPQVRAPCSAVQYVCVALAGAHRTGAAAVLCARLLHAHAARAHVLPAGDAVAAGNCSLLQRELAEFKLSGGKVASCTEALPSPDLVIIGLHDPQEPHDPEQYEEALRWVSGSRGAVVALEPPGEGGGGWGGVRARAALLGLLPAALPPALGRAYLANLAPPPAIFRDRALPYRPPFGAAALLPLHPHPH
ncbi:unnamed protein product [Parnassius mnemosyne]|uniref:DFDF domain-containing protein n=1 Tax=Parnassius mnemosyne TaxID=213953 RepID=A0AAV1KMZ0_9NEOP